MAIVCPTVTAYNQEEYLDQFAKIKTLASRIHVDIMDGQFSEKISVSLDEISWPEFYVIDIHLMALRSEEYLEQLIKLRPHMVIIHKEVEVDHMLMAAKLHEAGIKAGLALLQDTPVSAADQVMHSFDQVLIFSGHLGYQGGEADLNLLAKVKQVREDNPTAEIAWDGGVNEQNAVALIQAGVDVLNVGGYLQNDSEPEKAYTRIMEKVREASG